MDLRNFDLNLLRVLDALLQEGSTVKAGARIGLSQPAVSAALGRLRHAMGDALFVRRGQGLEPTDFARSLAIPLNETLEGIGSLLSAPGEFDPSRANDRFRISGSDSFGEMLMPQLLQCLSRLGSNMRIHMVDLVPDRQFEAMDLHQIDIALQPTAPIPDWADSCRVMSCGFKLIARRDHPRFCHANVGPGEVVPVDLYCDLGHVLFSNIGQPDGVGDHALERIGRKRQVMLTLPFFYGIFSAVAGSDLVALVPEQMTDRLASSLGLDVYEPPVPVPPIELSMIWNRRSSANPAHRWLRSQIAEILAPIDSLRRGAGEADASGNAAWRNGAP